MYIAKKSKLSRKKILAFAVLAILFVGGVVAALEKLHVINIINSTPETSSGPTEAQKAEQKKIEQQQKKDFIESSEPTPNSETPDGQSNSIELTAQQESNGSVTVLTKLYSVSDGTCSLAISNGPASYSQSADIIYQPSFSSCAGFSVAKDKLGAGLWTITLTTTGDSQLKKVITLKVN